MTCAAKGCTKAVPEFARAQGDPYCSSTCFKLAHGISVKVGHDTLPGDALDDYDPPSES